MFDLYEELRAVAGALERAGVRHALVGGLAVSLYARPRATEDIDLLISPDDLERCAAAVEDLGFRLMPSVFEFARAGFSMRRFTKLAGADHLVLDVLLAAREDLAQMLVRRVAVEQTDGTLWLVTVDDLRTLKRLRGAPQDLADLAALDGEGTS